MKRINVQAGYIYLIWESGTNNYKIGKTTDLKRRLAQLQTGASRELKLQHSIWVSDMATVELALHQQFASRRIRKKGEWFYFSRNAQAAIAAMDRLEAYYRNPVPSKSESAIFKYRVAAAILIAGVFWFFAICIPSHQKPSPQQYQHPTHQQKRAA